MRQVVEMFFRFMVCSVVVMSITADAALADHRVDLNLAGAFPQGEFKDQIDAGFGLSGGYTYGFFSDSPVSLRIGADAGFLIYGHETRQEPFSETVPDVTVEVETSNNIGQFGFVVMIASTQGPLRPYFEGRAGASYFYTDTSISDVDGDGESDIARSKNFEDHAAYTSLGGGVLIPVYQQINYSGNGVTVSVDLRFRYSWGDEADYLKEGSIVRSNGMVTYNAIHSKTDMTTAHLGVAVNF